MNLEEYKKWLEQNGNQEEKMAYDVVKVILYHHTLNIYSDYKVDLHPRRVFNTKKERLEFDLLIELEWESNRKYKRLIGVEFKETDFSKVVVQAIARREFVDYMYVATRNVIPDKVDLFRLFDFGIGWVIWSEDFVKLLYPASYYRAGNVVSLIEYLSRKILEEKIEEIRLKQRIAENMSLFEFGVIE